jgi:hypothetical protein
MQRCDARRQSQGYIPDEQGMDKQWTENTRAPNQAPIFFDSSPMPRRGGRNGIYSSRPSINPIVPTSSFPSGQQTRPLKAWTTGSLCSLRGGTREREGEGTASFYPGGPHMTAHRWHDNPNTRIRFSHRRTTGEPKAPKRPQRRGDTTLNGRVQWNRMCKRKRMRKRMWGREEGWGEGKGTT